MRSRPTALTALAAAAALTLAACGEDAETPEEKGDPTAEQPPAGDELPTVEGGYGEEPAIAFPDTAAPADLQVEVLEPGDGEEVGPDDFVVADYHGQVWGVDDAFDTSFAEERGPTGFNLNMVIDGWQEGLAGTHVGDRVLLSIPSELGYGAQGGGEAIPPDSDLVFVVDVMAAYGPDSTGEADAEVQGSAEELSLTVEGEPGSPATITVDEDAEPPEDPEDLPRVVLAEGSGDPVPEGQDAVIQFAWTTWDNDTGSSTWEDLGAINAMNQQAGIGALWMELADLPVGSRVAMTLPGSADGAEPAMAFVLDIIAPIPAER